MPPFLLAVEIDFECMPVVSFIHEEEFTMIFDTMTNKSRGCFVSTYGL